MRIISSNRLRAFADKYLSLFIMPFGVNLPYLLILWLILSIMNVYGWSRMGYMKYAVYFMAWNFLVAYVVLLVVPLLRRKWLKRAYLSITFFIAILSGLIDHFFWVTLKGKDYFQVPEIVRNTNFDEAKDFFAHNFDFAPLLNVVAITIVMVVIFLVAKRFAKNCRLNSVIGSVFALCCILLCLHYPYAHTDSIIGKAEFWAESFTRKTPDLKDYYHPNLCVEVEKELPANLVIIIGESYSRHHSSLYSYEKPTNPCLSAYDTTSLYVFTDVESPDLYTLGSFKKFMTASSDSLDQQWYEAITIQELLSKAGYHTTWISNQNRVGFCDNDLTAFANMTDQQYFVKDKALRVQAETYDEAIVPLVKQAISDSKANTKTLYWVHLMGSHTCFNNRYTKDFDKFQPDDYQSQPANQRENLSQYDNSLLYNDFVVDQLLKQFKDTESLVIYFADHGLDIYYTDPGYCSYGRATVPESAKAASQIPFIVFVSDSLKAARPDITEHLIEQQSRYMNTDTLINFVASLLGINSPLISAQ